MAPGYVLSTPFHLGGSPSCCVCLAGYLHQILHSSCRLLEYTGLFFCSEAFVLVFPSASMLCIRPSRAWSCSAFRSRVPPTPATIECPASCPLLFCLFPSVTLFPSSPSSHPIETQFVFLVCFKSLLILSYRKTGSTAQSLALKGCLSWFGNVLNEGMSKTHQQVPMMTK